MALLATTGAVAGGFPAAVAAFIVVGALDHADRAVVAARPARGGDPEGDRERDARGHPAQALPRAVSRARQGPWLAGAILITWLLFTRFARSYAVPAAVAVALVGMAFDAPFAGMTPPISFRT